MMRYPAKRILGMCLLTAAMPVGATVGDTGSYVESVEPDGSREIKAWIDVRETGEHFLTIVVDSKGVVRKICADPYPIPAGALDATNGASNAVTTWTIELLKRKGHGRARAGFWNGLPGQQLEKQLEAGSLPDECGLP